MRTIAYTTTYLMRGRAITYTRAHVTTNPFTVGLRVVSNQISKMCRQYAQTM